jgi:uracil-DNA glycosylase family 4
MFVGMGAGKDEDINLNRRNTHRQPWVGRAGKYLRSIIKYLWDSGIKFNVAFSNTVRCHPRDSRGKDRQPTTIEESWCGSFLKRDIESVRPEVIVTCGASSTICLTSYQEGTTMGRMHGVLWEGQDGELIIPTYHASYLTRQYGTFKPGEKNHFDKKVILDIVKAVDIATRGDTDVSSLEAIT